MTTVAQLKQFEKAVKKYLPMVPEWEVAVMMKKGKGWRAQCQMDSQSKLAAILLDSHLNPKTLTEKEIEMLALHEVLHIVLFDLARIAEVDGRSTAVDRIEHEIINRVCNFLTPKL